MKKNAAVGEMKLVTHTTHIVEVLFNIFPIYEYV